MKERRNHVAKKKDGILHRIFFYNRDFFCSRRNRLSCVSLVLANLARFANSVLSIPIDEKLGTMPRARMRCSETEYSLLLVSRGEVLGARRCSVARVAAVQGVLREETAIVLVHSTRPESRALCEFYPGTVLRLELGLHGRRRPLQISSHIACRRSFCCCGLGLVHRCWCLWIKTESQIEQRVIIKS